MGRFTDSQSLPAMPNGMSPLHALDNDGNEMSSGSFISQAWAGDPPLGQEHVDPEDSAPDADDN